MTSVHDLDDEQLRAELERTRDAYAEYVRDVGEHPTHSTRDLDDGARRHLDVREELDRRAAGHRDVPLDRDAGGQAGGGHVDPAELEASRQASYDDAGGPDTAAAGSVSGGSGSGGYGSGGGGSDTGGSGGGSDGRGGNGGSGGGKGGPNGNESGADANEDLPDKLDPGEIEPYA